MPKAPRGSMEEPPPKRAKLHNPRGGRGDDYLPGNIIEIELRNFMTYDYLRCEPAPRLNLVIGPNGSGKSSLVCAIALGLGGDPQILGRASSIGAFVKRGEDSGHVLISLKGMASGETVTVMRKIDTQNKSDWLLNGASVPKRDVLDIIRKFNIQVGNLTQFLPQDRVCEFAKLTPIQLLEETEKAVGDPDLPVQHNALVERSRELKKLELTVKQNRDSLNQLKALNAEQERDVGRVRQREQLLAKAETMKKKLPWLKYDVKKMEYKNAQKLESEAKGKLREAAKLLNTLSAPIEEKKKLKAEHEKTCKKISVLLNNNAKKYAEVTGFERQLAVQVRSKLTDMEERKKKEESRQQQIQKAIEDLAAAETELGNLPFYEPPRDAIEKLNAQIMELEVEANQKRLQRSEKENHLVQKKGGLRQCLDRLREMENKTMKLLQALKNSGAEKIVEAYNWLQSHRNELRKEVYGPVLLEVNIDDRVHASYLEGQIPSYIWKSVITQDPADRDLLVKNLKSFDIPVLNYVKDVSHGEIFFEISPELRELGIYTRLDQVFVAPDVVREILISQSSISNSYIGTRETEQRADEIPKTGILDFWTPESHYRWSVSRYNGHTSASVEAVRPSRLFLYSSDSGDLERLRSRSKELEEAIANLEEGVKTLQLEQRKLEDDASLLHKEREELVNTVRFEKKKRRELENRAEQRRRKLESMRNEEDLESSNNKLHDEVAQLNKRRFQLAVQVKDLLVESVSHKSSLAGKLMRSVEIDMKIRELESDLKHHEKAALHASTEVERCKNETEVHRKQLSIAKQDAEAAAVITEELAQKFLEMPSTIEELEGAIQDTIAQANSILFVNQNILKEYEARQLKIDALSARLESDNKELSRCMSEITGLKDKWLPTLRILIAKINETFGRNFQEMAVAGEVSLDERDMDFDKYGILIKVKFRKTGHLQVLSAHHQSGGERSVSTVLYLVSLQDLTNCPFRVVDEINQGMDLINERKMFQQLVRAASQHITPQCFLLTPKLLDNLEYSDACSVLNIMNGPWVEDASSGNPFDLENLLHVSFHQSGERLIRGFIALFSVGQIASARKCGAATGDVLGLMMGGSKSCYSIAKWHASRV